MKEHLKTNRRLKAKVEQQIEATKNRLAAAIRDEIAAQGLSQTEASYIIGDAPSQISLICCGKLRGFSIERLMRSCALLGANVGVMVSQGARVGVSAHIARVA